MYCFISVQDVRLGGLFFCPSCCIMTCYVCADIVYTRDWAEAWLDPANWRAEGSNARDPVPHLERIPCTHDRIRFPGASSFRVRLPEVPVTVGSVSLLGQVMLCREIFFIVIRLIMLSVGFNSSLSTR